MVEAIQAHVGGLNWGYRVALREKKVQYLNAYAEFVDAHTLKVSPSFSTFCLSIQIELQEHKSVQHKLYKLCYFLTIWKNSLVIWTVNQFEENYQEY